MKFYKTICKLGGCCGKKPDERCLRQAGDICMMVGAGAIVGSVMTWFWGLGGREEKQRRAIFIGLWVPSLFSAAGYLSRKADERADEDGFEDIPFTEEFM